MDTTKSFIVEGNAVNSLFFFFIKVRLSRFCDISKIRSKKTSFSCTITILHYTPQSEVKKIIISFFQYFGPSMAQRDPLLPHSSLTQEYDPYHLQIYII